MKALYVTDLHGDEKKYAKTLELAKENKVEIVINGGDILPKRGDLFKIQRDFLEEFLPEYFGQVESLGLQYLIMPGNDDLVAYDPVFEELCSKFPSVHNIAQKKVTVDGFEFIGMNKILDTPFPRKDRIVREERHVPETQRSSKIYMTGPFGSREISDWEVVREKFPQMSDVLKDLPEPDRPKRAVYIMHEPPKGLNLAWAYNLDEEIGSLDVLDFIKERQPLFTLHGHLHESPLLKKTVAAQIGRTISIQPGQSEFGDSWMTYVLLDLNHGEFKWDVTPV